jgi:hypothetical protein
MNDVIDELGPIDYVVVEFPADKVGFSGEMHAHLKSLVKDGIIRILDMLVVTKDGDGAVDAFEVHEFDHDEADALSELGEEIAELLSEEDVGHIAAALELGTVAAVLVWENGWAGPFASSVRRSGGQLVANGRIPVQAILAAVEAEEDAGQTKGA